MGRRQVLAGALLGALALAGCTSTYAGRYVWWNLPDLDDYEKFPYHPIETADTGHEFERGPAPEALRHVRYVYKGVLVEQPLEDFLIDSGTSAFIVLQDGKLVYEQYFRGHQRDTRFTSLSITKTFLSALAGIALEEGTLDSLEVPITRYVPELRDRPGFGRITLRHLLTMASGIAYQHGGFPWSDAPILYYHPHLKELLRELEVVRPPGGHFLYNQYNALLMGLALERAAGMTVSAYLEQKLWKPLGMAYPATWSLDSEASGVEKMESGLNATAIDFARFGQLYLNQGRWRGRPILPADWVRRTTRDFGRGVVEHSEYYGYFWWGMQREGGGYDFYAIGKDGQYIYVSPPSNLVIVRFGPRKGPVAHWPETLRRMAVRLAPPGPGAWESP